MCEKYSTMKPRILKLLLLIATVINAISCSEKEKECILKGKVIGRDSEAIMLYKATQFPKLEAEIPIVNNRFEYNLSFTHPEAFELVFKEEFESGSMMVNSFFAEESEIGVHDRHQGDHRHEPDHPLPLRFCLFQDSQDRFPGNLGGKFFFF